MNARIEMQSITSVVHNGTLFQDLLTRAAHVIFCAIALVRDTDRGVFRVFGWTFFGNLVEFLLLRVDHVP